MSKIRAEHPAQSWVVVLLLLGFTSTVEALSVSQIFAFMPLYLEGLGVPGPDVGRWIGWLSALIFVLGLPLVPLWGVWADKYSRKAVIIRSALVEALVCAFVALSREPWHFAGSLMLAGFQLGNTGVMLAALRDVAPRRRLGTAIAVFGASSPIGFALGPAIGGLMVDHLHAPLAAVFATSALLSLGAATILSLGFRDVRPEAPPVGRTLDLAYGAIRGVLVEPVTRRLFAIFGIAFLARQIAGPFLPLLVQQLNRDQLGEASAIATVVGTAALVGGLISPVAGALGDRFGFRPVLSFGLGGVGVALATMPFAPDVPRLAALNVAFAALNATVGAMIFGLLADEVPAERKSATLNLVYLPLYITGIVGPAIGAGIIGAGLSVVFTVAGLTPIIGILLVGRKQKRSV